jgi:C4-type Zn-finger protein
LVKYMSPHFCKKCCYKSHYVRGLKSEEPIKEGAYIIAKIP